jgi:DNA-binding response OmpR family regulator
MANSSSVLGFGPSNAEINPTGRLQECILLIEDNEEAIFLVKSAVEEYGNGRYRLVLANCLKDGLDQLSKGGVDLVLLDLGLPESSGAATYESVRAVAMGVPVLVLTGDAAEETELKVTGGGGDDYLIKDQVSGSLLLQAIRSALHANELRRRAAANSNGNV